MTTADEYWQRLCRKTPRLAGDGATAMKLTIAEFRRAITRAYECGQQSPGENKSDGDNESEGDFGDLLGRLFSGRN